jgi:hypothetical protein
VRGDDRKRRGGGRDVLRVLMVTSPRPFHVTRYTLHPRRHRHHQHHLHRKGPFDRGTQTYTL